jgi:predicted enzyme related to lactoylglutathione lyase
MSEEQQVLGKFVWRDLVTTDIDQAIAFYTSLFGWTIKEADMGPMGTYKMIHTADTEHGGFMQLDASHGAPPHWVSYCTVPDVAAAVATAEKLGGKTHVPPTDIPGIGTFAMIADREGAVISPFKPLTWAGEGITAPWPAGTFCWQELLAIDPEGEGKFHAEVFGWKITPMDMGPMGTYYLFKRDNEKDGGGMLQKPAESPGPSSWFPYVAVENTHASAARIAELGGKIWVEPRDIPNVGRFAVASDPQGAQFAILGPSS